METGAADGAKTALRDQIVTARRRRSLIDVGEAARMIAQHLLAARELRMAATVAAYISTGQEPGTGPLVDRLRATGRHVLLPVLLSDNDLAWGRYTGPDGLIPAGRGLLEPSGEVLDPDAVATADVVIVPALAVDRHGVRLGRGGGSYDRALARVPEGTFVCALLYGEELLDAVPADPHDHPVSAVATPKGITRLR